MWKINLPIFKVCNPTFFDLRYIYIWRPMKNELVGKYKLIELK